MKNLDQQPTSDQRSPANNPTWRAKAVVFTVGIILIILMVRCIVYTDAKLKKSMEDVVEKRFESGRANKPYHNFIYVEAAGLSLRVPRELSKMTESKVFPERVVSLHKFTCVHETRAIEVKHFVFHESGEWTVDKFKQLDWADSKLERSLYVSGLRCDIYNDKKKSDLLGTKMDRSIMNIYKGNEGWEVHVLGVNDKNLTDLNQMRNRIFDSIEIME